MLKSWGKERMEYINLVKAMFGATDTDDEIEITKKIKALPGEVKEQQVVGRRNK